MSFPSYLSEKVLKDFPGENIPAFSIIDLDDDLHLSIPSFLSKTQQNIELSEIILGVVFQKTKIVADIILKNPILLKGLCVNDTLDTATIYLSQGCTPTDSSHKYVSQNLDQEYILSCLFSLQNIQEIKSQVKRIFLFESPGILGLQNIY